MRVIRRPCCMCPVLHMASQHMGQPSLPTGSFQRPRGEVCWASVAEWRSDGGPSITQLLPRLLGV